MMTRAMRVYMSCVICYAKIYYVSNRQIFKKGFLKKKKLICQFTIINYVVIKSNLDVTNNSVYFNKILPYPYRYILSI